MASGQNLSAAGATDVGRRRHNEDAWLVNPDTGLVLVADGVGGHHAGEVASQITAETIAQEVDAGSGLGEAVRAANLAVMAGVADGRGKSGMASTVVAATVRGAQFEIAWVGDSRAYLWDGSLKLLTRDHSLIERLLASGEVQPHEVKDHPQRNVIVQAIGLQAESDLRVDTNAGVLRDGDILLLCSDGMSDVLDNATIAGILSETTSLEARCERLVERSIALGGRDNSTVILVEGQSNTDGEIVTPDVVWTFDPRTGKTSGQLEVAPVAPALEAAASQSESPQTTQMMSVSEVEKALASMDPEAQSASKATSTPQQSGGKLIAGVAAIFVVLLVIGAFLLL